MRYQGSVYLTKHTAAASFAVLGINTASRSAYGCFPVDSVEVNMRWVVESDAAARVLKRFNRQQTK